jgi:hypothetical protein
MDGLSYRDYDRVAMPMSFQNVERIASTYFTVKEISYRRTAGFFIDRHWGRR